MIEDIKKTLWATADKLRANMDAAEYKHIVLGLIFVKYISDTFQTRRAELMRKFADAGDDYFLDGSDQAQVNEELEDRDYYKEVNVFWVPEAARWESLRAQAKQADIGKRIDDALSLIETENPKLKGILDKRYARVQLPDGHTRCCCDKPGYNRAIYCVEITPKLFDVFFNSQTGYRGAYFQSPEIGLAANRLMLRIVAPKLVAWTRAYCADQNPEFAAKSLSMESAKAWLAEDEHSLSLCERCKGEWSASMRASLEIINGRWECDSHIHAEWGRQAYRLRKIRFIGAFLNDAGDEYVAPQKKWRANEISARGWS